MTGGMLAFQGMQWMFVAIALVASILAPKIITTIALISAFYGLYHVFRAGMPVIIYTPVVIVFAALCIWAATTSLWAASPHQGLEVAIKVAGIFGAGGICFCAAGLVRAKAADLELPLYSGAGLGLLGVMTAMLHALVTNDSLWGSYFNDPLTTLNNSAIIFALLLWPIGWLLWHRSISLAVVAVVIWLGILLCLSSMAAVFSIFAGIVPLILYRYCGRIGGVIMAGAVAMMLIIAPYLVKVSHLDFFANPKVIQSESIMPNSVLHRLAMWSFATEKIEERPWLGWGVGSSRHIPQDDRRLARNMEIMPLHPHNMALQIRLELGLPGILLLSGLAFLILYRFATCSDDTRICAVASAAAVSWLFVANVSFGIWQSWWLATAFMLAAIMRTVFQVNVR